VFKYISIALIAFYLSGCATLSGAGKKDVTISSDPSGAEVYLNGEKIGVTPIEHTINPRKIPNLTIKLEGYKTASYSFKTVHNTKVRRNVALGPLYFIGEGIDGMTSSYMTVEEDDVHISLEKEE